MIAIRVDSNDIIAMGHIMRCLSIADRLKENPLFICSEESTRKIVEKANYTCLCLHNKYTDKEAELDKMLEIIVQQEINVLLVDSYEVTETYLKKLHTKTCIVYIDDLNKIYYDVDMIINYTYKTDKRIYDKWQYTSHMQYLLGSKYAPLRKQFEQSPIEIKGAKEIFVTTGGTDPYHVILGLIKLLKNKNYVLNIVLGNYYHDDQELSETVKGNERIILYKNINNMAEVMKKSDLAISAGGTTLIELFTLGIPTICFTMADNQMEGVKNYAQNGIAMYAGDVRYNRDSVLQQIVNGIETFAVDIEKRKEMSACMQASFDGKGAIRIAKCLEQLENVDRKIKQ